MDVIDLCNDNQVPTEQRFATNIPREVRKTVNHLLHTVGEIRTFMNRDDLTRYVLNYCNKNPNIKDIEILSMNIQTELLLNNIDSDPIAWYDDNKSTDLRITNSSSSNNTSNSSSSTTNKPVTSSTKVDKPSIVEVLSPLQEVLKVFPAAKKQYITSLLNKYNQSLEQVVQDMLEHGYEKETTIIPTTNTINNNHNNTNTTNSTMHTSKDFTSNTSWETSFEYRRNALVELNLNFPYIGIKSLQSIFAYHKSHFYHALKYLEDLLGLQVLYRY